MNVLGRLERNRWIVWIAWPTAVLVIPLVVIYLIATARGWGVYYDLDFREVLRLGVVMFGPPALFEVLVRRGRSTG